MDDYISRKAFLRWAHEFYPVPVLISGIINAPAADVKLVKRAWWIDDEDSLICSSCDAKIEATNSFGEENHRNYCPNCGATMY